MDLMITLSPFLRKFFLIILFPLIFLSVAYAQESITVGTPYNVIDGQYKTYFEKEGKLLAIKVEAKRVFIQLFDQSTLKLLKRTHFDLSGNQTFEKVAEINGHYFVFYSIISNRENNVHLFCKEINLVTGNVMESRLILKSKKTLFGIQSLNAEATPSLISEKNRDYSPKFNFEFSEDKSKICIHYNSVPAVDKEVSLIGMHILNQDLTVISSREEEVPYSLYNVLMLDYAVDNQGSLYMARNTYEEKIPWFQRAIRNDSPYQTSILIFPWNGSACVSNTIVLPDKKISRLKFAESNRGLMKIAGFYHQEGTPVCIKGFFSSSINYSTWKLEKVICHDIPTDILNPYLNSKGEVQTSTQSYLEDLVLKKVMVQDDNSLLLIGEQVYDIEKTKSYPGEQKQIDLNHHYNDILVCKLDSVGNIAWLKRLPKRQVGGKERGGMSYRYITFSGNHFFLFLDNVKNKSLAPNIRPSAHLNEQGGQLTYYKIEDSNGEWYKKNIFDMRNVNGYSLYQFSSNRITKINESELILELYKRENEDLLVKIKLF